MKALITGASSGIGEAYAAKFASMGYDLILTGRRENLLENIASDLRGKYHVSVETLTIELSDDHQLNRLYEKILQTEDLHILVNNAGFGARLHFLDEDFSRQEDMIKVHILAPMKLIHAALPGMIKNGGGILINVSSISCKTPVPKGAIYSGTKSFLRSFSESLYLENMHSNIMVQSLCPGFTRTDFHKRIGIEDGSRKNMGIVHWMSPEKVVELSLKNLKKGKVTYVPGFWNKVLWIIADSIPRKIYYSIISKAEDKSVLIQSIQTK